MPIRGCFINYTLNQLFSTRYNDCPSPLALFYEVTQTQKVLKNLLLGLDIIGRDILNFINHKPAQYIIGSLLTCKNFGHHDTYIFPEFSIGNGKYYADYLIVGKNSGGYEFVFVELEAPNKRTTIKSGYEGQAMRSGLNQIFDWKCQIESDFASITKEFEKSCIQIEKLPIEFRQYDSTRMHYMVIAGLRDDYNDVTYRTRRLRSREQGIEMYHYDNLIDFSKLLEDSPAF